MNQASDLEPAVLRTCFQRALLSALLAMAFCSQPAAALSDKCLIGDAPVVANDPTQIRAVRSLIDASCLCASFDGSKGKTHRDYVKCAAAVISAQVAAVTLRPECARTVKKLYVQSSCGKDPSQLPQPCIKKVAKSGKVSCSIKARAKCRSGRNFTRSACPLQTTCIDAGDTNGDLLIGVPGDSGACVGSFDWRDAVLYFAFVDRFADGNPANNGSPLPGVSPAADYQGGDWAGVQQKIDSGYFTDLGVNVLWLSVPADNPSAAGLGSDGRLYGPYDGYWPANLDQTESRFGTLAELTALVDAAHQRGIRVILDYVMNHLHDTSPLYAQHPEWFWPDNISGQSCLCGSAACPVDGANAKRCWLASYLPDFNFTVEAARNYSVDNVLAWIEQTGVDGLRLDGVAFVEDSWTLDLRARVAAEIEPTRGQHFYMVGDTYTADPAILKNAVTTAKLDGQFDYPLRARLVRSLLMGDSSASGVMSALETFLAANDTYYGSGVMSTLAGNHNLPRAIHFAEDVPLWSDEWNDGGDRAWSNRPTQPSGTAAYDRLNNLFTILYTSRGIPLIYYGDEVGLAGAGEPDNRRMMPWAGYNAGQTKVSNHLKKLATIRAAHPALRRGTRTSIAATDDTLVYRMSEGQDVIFVAVNRSNFSQPVSGLPSGTLNELLAGDTVNGPTLTLPARSAVILAVP